jgi:hypothetical protein
MIGKFQRTPRVEILVPLRETAALPIMVLSSPAGEHFSCSMTSFTPRLALCFRGGTSPGALARQVILTSVFCAEASALELIGHLAGEGGLSQATPSAGRSSAFLLLPLRRAISIIAAFARLHTSSQSSSWPPCLEERFPAKFGRDGGHPSNYWHGVPTSAFLLFVLSRTRLVPWSL